MSTWAAVAISCPIFTPMRATKLLFSSPYTVLREDIGSTIHGAFARHHHKMEHKRERMKQRSTVLPLAFVGSMQAALLQELKWKWKHHHFSPLRSQNTFPCGGSLKDQIAFPSVLPSLLWVSSQFSALLRGMCPLKQP